MPAMTIEDISAAVAGILARLRERLPDVAGEPELQALVASFTGKKGELTLLLAQMKDLPADARPEAGRIMNEAKNAIAREAGEVLDRLKARRVEQAMAAAAVDVTLPGFGASPGRLHPLRETLDEIVHVFTCLGFDIAEGPEIETDWHNFEALGFPPDHPARQMQATFFVDSPDRLVLRTHTSPVQVRRMLAGPPPVKIIAPGVVYRHDDDPTHSPMFIQVEGLMVDDHTTMADLKGTLELFLGEMFGRDVPVRFRASFFPFTEPSGEVDIACPVCGTAGRAGCPVCKGSGWTEILGCGQVDPVVFESVGLDPERWQGFAFGLGVDRMTMFKHGIDSIQHFYRNDPRFIRQF